MYLFLGGMLRTFSITTIVMEQSAIRSEETKVCAYLRTDIRIYY